ncbi:hypothetical protein NPIL_335761, partial [Nephila pilipes]
MPTGLFRCSGPPGRRMRVRQRLCLLRRQHRVRRRQVRLHRRIQGRPAPQGGRPLSSSEYGDVPGEQLPDDHDQCRRRSGHLHGAPLSRAQVIQQ